MNKYLVRPWHLFRRHGYFQRYLQSCASQGVAPRLHVGCGDRPIAGWCNIDVSHLTADVQYVDALKPLPFGSESFQYVFSEHFIEHLSFADGVVFFKEAHRILKKGGIIRTATPDLRFLSRLYDPKTAEREHYIRYVAENFDRDKPRSPVTCFNRSFYGWGHRFLYDAEFLEQVLAPLGFGGFRSFKPGQSETEDLKKLEQHGKSAPSEINEMETFVLEATKL